MTTDGDPDVCWHCRAVLMPEPAPHCDQCPPFGDCDELGCDEPGCTGDPVTLAMTERQRLRDLLRRVIDDGNDATALRALARDIARELGAADPLAQN